MDTKPIPAFDEWFRSQHCGQSFDEVHGGYGIPYSHTFAAMMDFCQRYITETVAASHTRS